MKKQTGFTLIELLVVIAIIGLLSTIAVISLSTARGKARDAQRLSDVRQLSTALDLEDAASPGAATTGCVVGDAKTTACTGPGDIAGFVNLKDPTAKGAGAACTSASVATCDYAISQQAGGAGAPTTANYQICFWMEAASNIGAAGLWSIEPNGQFVAGCSA